MSLCSKKIKSSFRELWNPGPKEQYFLVVADEYYTKGSQGRLVCKKKSTFVKKNKYVAFGELSTCFILCFKLLSRLQIYKGNRWKWRSRRLTRIIRLFSARQGEKWESKIFASVTQTPSPLQRNLIAEMEPDANAGPAANSSVLVKHWHLLGSF